LIKKPGHRFKQRNHKTLKKKSVNFYACGLSGQAGRKRAVNPLRFFSGMGLTGPAVSGILVVYTTKSPEHTRLPSKKFFAASYGRGIPAAKIDFLMHAALPRIVSGVKRRNPVNGQ
jgi:hypothetical protein